ncbi:MAG: hypothetical protein Q9M94_03750 [Candidatus Gracilibacteria bacterium]|nr:hypothetical protein [Candidatus Gracilibacteria bacterium]
MSNHKQSKKLRQIDKGGKLGIEIQQSHEGILPPTSELEILEKL